MSKLHPNEPEREYTQGEQNQSFIGRRMEAFAERSRDPGDATTWAVVLGALMCTLLMICFAIAERPMYSLITFGLTVVWIAYASHFGRVNVFSILWGSSTADAKVDPDHLAIFRSTAVLALISIIAIIGDAVSGWGFGYYGFALIATVLLYFGVVYRTWIAPTN